MIYGNIARNLNKQPVREQYIDESCIFDYRDYNFVVETVTSAIFNDDMQLLEYCDEFTDPELLVEASDSIFSKIADGIKSIITAIKNFFTSIINKIKEFFGKKKEHDTDENGKLKPEVVKKIESGELRVYNAPSKEENTSDSSNVTSSSSSGNNSSENSQKALPGSKQYALPAPRKARYLTIEDLAGKKLHTPVTVPRYTNTIDDKTDFMADVNQFERNINRIKSMAQRINFKNLQGEISDEDLEDYRSIAEECDEEMKRMTDQYTENIGFKTETLDELSSGKLKMIVRNSNTKFSDVEKELKGALDDSLKELEQYQKNLSPLIPEKSSEAYKKMKAPMTVPQFEKYKQYTAKMLLNCSKCVYTHYQRFSTYLEKAILCCSKARDQLEKELEWQNMYGD